MPTASPIIIDRPVVDVPSVRNEVPIAMIDVERPIPIRAAPRGISAASSAAKVMIMTMTATTMPIISAGGSASVSLAEPALSTFRPASVPAFFAAATASIDSSETSLTSPKEKWICAVRPSLLRFSAAAAPTVGFGIAAFSAAVSCGTSRSFVTTVFTAAALPPWSSRCPFVDCSTTVAVGACVFAVSGNFSCSTFCASTARLPGRLKSSLKGLDSDDPAAPIARKATIQSTRTSHHFR